MTDHDAFARLCSALGFSHILRKPGLVEVETIYLKGGPQRGNFLHATIEEILAA